MLIQKPYGTPFLPETFLLVYIYMYLVVKVMLCLNENSLKKSCIIVHRVNEGNDVVFV